MIRFIIYLLLINLFLSCQSNSKKKQFEEKDVPKEITDSSIENDKGDRSKVTEDSKVDTTKLLSEIPEDFALYVKKNHSNLKFPHFSNYYRGWENFYDKIRNPYFVSGDFNGDGLTDFASLLTSSDGKELYLYVFLKIENNIYNEIKLKSRTLTGYKDQSIIPVGLFVEKRGSKISLLEEENSEILMNFDGIVYSIFETASKLYYYDREKKKFNEYVAGD